MVSLNRINSHVKLIFEFEALFLHIKEYNIYISYVQLNELIYHRIVIYLMFNIICSIDFNRWNSSRPHKISRQRRFFIREVKIPRFRFTGTSIAILFIHLPVISTRFPSVNQGLHVKDKRVRVFSVCYMWGPSRQ
jgi:hypothetical protein